MGETGDQVEPIELPYSIGPAHLGDYAFVIVDRSLRRDILIRQSLIHHQLASRSGKSPEVGIVRVDVAELGLQPHTLCLRVGQSSVVQGVQPSVLASAGGVAESFGAQR